MRDPQRINKVTALLRDYWFAHPDLRFFQVVELLKTNILSTRGDSNNWDEFDPFYVEDDETSSALEKMQKG